eukprot:jgi/Tetstr1/433209/TSEL_022497.t1
MRIRLPSREVKVQSRKSKAITKADLPALSGHEVQKMREDPNKEIKEGFRKGNNHQPQRLLKSGKVLYIHHVGSLQRHAKLKDENRQTVNKYQKPIALFAKDLNMAATDGTTIVDVTAGTRTTTDNT